MSSQSDQAVAQDEDAPCQKPSGFNLMDYSTSQIDLGAAGSGGSPNLAELHQGDSGVQASAVILDVACDVAGGGKVGGGGQRVSDIEHEGTFDQSNEGSLIAGMAAITQATTGAAGTELTLQTTVHNGRSNNNLDSSAAKNNALDQSATVAVARVCDDDAIPMEDCEIVRNEPRRVKSPKNQDGEGSHLSSVDAALFDGDVVHPVPEKETSNKMKPVDHAQTKEEKARRIKTAAPGDALLTDDIDCWYGGDVEENWSMVSASSDGGWLSSRRTAIGCAETWREMRAGTGPGALLEKVFGAAWFHDTRRSMLVRLDDKGYYCSSPLKTSEIQNDSFSDVVRLQPARADASSAR